MSYLHAGLLIIALMVTATVSAVELADVDTIRRLAVAGDSAAAIAKLDERIAADVNDIQARFLKGLLLLDRGDKGAARDAFAEIARLFPRLPEAFNNLAAIYAEEGEYEKSRQALLSAIANAPDYPAVRANLGDLYAKMAVDSYRMALQLNPDDQASQARLKLLEQLFAGG